MNGKQNGQGKFTNSQGKTRIGLWENGSRIKWITIDGVTEVESSQFSGNKFNNAVKPG